MEKGLILPIEIRNAVVNYLIAQPYKDVNQLVAVLMNLSEIKENVLKETKNG